MVLPITPTDSAATRNLAVVEPPRSQATEIKPRPAATEQEPPASKPAQRLEGLRAEHNLPDGRKIEFSFDEAIDRVIVTVKSAESGKVVRQIPPEEYQRFLVRFNEMLGVLFDETA